MVFTGEDFVEPGDFVDGTRDLIDETGDGVDWFPSPIWSLSEPPLTGELEVEDPKGVLGLYLLSSSLLSASSILHVARAPSL
ncbi:hypothetical protein RRF57_008007 [Xylaria bambusicola]|uniref:Uncharacterized protein n=1 Tax=Xylaria bambusicola TaxID=326684 RepID=A0AAN7UM01_9PEZI